MASPSPLIEFHRSAGATLLAYGPQSQSADPTAGQAVPPIDLVATYASLELEYASLRKHCGLIDLPSRGLVEVTGPDRLDFLNRMVTQELRPGRKDLPPWSMARSFWLSRKGRIDADLRICVLPDRVLLEVDALAAPRTAGALSSFIIMEDCAVRDISQDNHCLGLHGPTAPSLLAAVCAPLHGAPPVQSLAPAGGVTRALIDSRPVTVLRDDQAGVPGFSLITDLKDALVVAQALVRAGHDAAHEPTGSSKHFSLPVLTPDAPRNPARFRLAPIGWLSFNIARIEAGTPMFNIDFGVESLPAETGQLDSRVSFTKGCYLGQEVVARMHARHQSKQQLVAVKFESTHAADDRPYPPLPEQGAPLLAEGAAVGRITSSTLSPLLGMAPIAFAQVRSTHAAPGTVLTAPGDVPQNAQPSPHSEVAPPTIKGVVQASLAFTQAAVTPP